MTPTDAYILIDAYHAEPIWVCYSMDTVFAAIRAYGKQWGMNEEEVQREIILIQDNPFDEDTAFKVKVVPIFR